jgi:seryl-tRNA synthetase
MDVDLTGLQLIAQQQRDLEESRSSLQADGNRIGKEVGQRIQSGADPKGAEVAELRLQGNQIKQRVAVLEDEEKQLTVRLREELLRYPNLPSEKCPDGRSEDDNKEVRRWGDPRVEDGLKEHWQIAEQLSLLDTERSVRIAQSRFVTLFGQGARLERALINFMLDLHTGKGYREVLPPVLVNSASLMRSGQLPKFAEESFRCADDDLWLTPTAEVPLTSLHRDEIIPSDQLPLRYVAYSPCFRREAGSYGRDTRGLIRLHQFNKVELYWLCIPSTLKRLMLRSLLTRKLFFRLWSCPIACSSFARVIWAFLPLAPMTSKFGWRVQMRTGKSQAAVCVPISRLVVPPSARKRARPHAWFIRSMAVALQLVAPWRPCLRTGNSLTEA